MGDLIFFAVLLGIGFFFGTRAEQQHLRDLQRREQQLGGFVISVAGAKVPLPEAAAAELFVGSVVVSSDYFKTVAASLLKLVGGRITVYETLLERGRREALLRMAETAIAWGADRVVNVRIETAELGGNNGQGIVALEVIAYGTGVR